MNRFLILAAVAVVAVAVIFAPRGGSAPVTMPKNTVAYLVQFGQDGKPDVDWSGTLTSSSVRPTGWQLDSGDGIKGSSWKLRTREQTYWDSPYERPNATDIQS